MLAGISDRLARFGRSFLGLVLAFALLNPVQARAADSPGAWVIPSQWAHAEWVVREQGRPMVYFVDVYRLAHPAFGLKTFASAGKASCPPAKRRDDVLRCGASVPSVEIPVQDFLIDPSLTTARVVVEIDGVENEVTWTGEGVAATPTHSEEFTPESRLLIHGRLERPAQAIGTVLGSTFDEGKGSMAFLQSGIAVIVHLDD